VKNVFKKVQPGEVEKNLSPIAKASSTKLMKVYRKDWREDVVSQTELCEPGRYHPEVTEWVEMVATAGGAPATPMAKTIKVVFRQGVAEVPQNLGIFLINANRAFAKPQPPMQPPKPSLSKEEIATNAAKAAYNAAMQAG
jgi:hypothetical protein